MQAHPRSPCKPMQALSICVHVKFENFLLVQWINLHARIAHACTSHRKNRPLEMQMFVVYRVLICCIDSSPFFSLYPKSSAGRFYMLHLRLPTRSRSTRSSARVIWSTPPGVSTNNVLLSIIPDLVKRTTDSVELHAPTGKRVRIFVDVVAFVADHPAASETLDFIGHKTYTLCTLCTFRKKTGVGESGIGYTPKVHAHRTTSMRCMERHGALRNSEIDIQDTKRLGMKDSSKIMAESSPLLALQRELERVCVDIATTRDAKRAMLGRFEEYCCNVVAPDHFLAGLEKNVIEVGLHVINCSALYTMKVQVYLPYQIAHTFSTCLTGTCGTPRLTSGSPRWPRGTPHPGWGQ